MKTYLALLVLASATAQMPQSVAIPGAIDKADERLQLCGPEDIRTRLVYRPERLILMHPCVRLTGTVAYIRKMADGDVHYGIIPDKPYRSLIGENERIIRAEAVCQVPTRHRQARRTCVLLRVPAYAVTKGARVEVGGPYVVDNQHKWVEIHPVMRMKVIE